MTKQQEEDRLKLHAALLEVLDEAMKVDEAACGKIRIYDPDSRSLEILAQRGFSEAFVRSFGAVDTKDGLPCARAFRLRHRVAIPDVTRDPQAGPYRDYATHEGFRAMQVTPVMDGHGQVLGTLSTHFPRVHHPSTAGGVLLDYLSRRVASLLQTFAPAR
jgi:GAF domain-containing protein